jgi:hypothetical protein
VSLAGDRLYGMYAFDAKNGGGTGIIRGDAANGGWSMEFKPHAAGSPVLALQGKVNPEGHFAGEVNPPSENGDKAVSLSTVPSGLTILMHELKASLVAGDGARPSFDWMTAYPQCKGLTALNHEIATALSRRPVAAKQDAMEALIDLAADGLRQQVREMREIEKAEPIADGGGLPAGQDESQVAFVQFVSEHLLGIEIFRYSFTGGAHPNWSSEFRLYDQSSGKRIAMDDIVAGGPAHRDALLKLVREAILKQLGAEPGSSLKDAGLYEDEIKLSTSFYLTPEEVVFYYPPYDIAPYALGEFRVALPQAVVKEHLKADSPVAEIAK